MVLARLLVPLVRLVLAPVLFVLLVKLSVLLLVRLVVLLLLVVLLPITWPLPMRVGTVAQHVLRCCKGLVLAQAAARVVWWHCRQRVFIVVYTVITIVIPLAFRHVRYIHSVRREQTINKSNHLALLLHLISSLDLLLHSITCNRL